MGSDCDGRGDMVMTLVVVVAAIRILEGCNSNHTKSVIISVHCCTTHVKSL